MAPRVNKKHWRRVLVKDWKCGAVYECRVCRLRYCVHMCKGHRKSCAGVDLSPDERLQKLNSDAMKEWWARK
jgi:hypothetical protein